MENFYLNILGLKKEDYQPNPKRNEINTLDCAIRAFCKLLDKDWDTVFYDLSKIAFDEKQIFNHPNVIEKYANINGYTYTKVIGKLVQTAGEFMYNHKYGKYIIGIPGHVFAYIDGIIHDRDNCDVDKMILSKLLYYISCTSISLPGGKNITYMKHCDIKL